MMMKKITRIILILIISLLIGISLSFMTYTVFQNVKKRQIRLEKRKLAWVGLKQAFGNEIKNFKGIAGIVIKDLDRGFELSLNKHRLFPSASLAKVPIVASCFYAVAEGRMDLNKTLLLKANHKVPGSGKLKHAPVGKKFSVEKLIELMISESDNTAANMLIELLGFDYLNQSFKRLGLKHTNISRMMMDFKSRRKGLENYTSCRDLAYLFERIYNKRLINKDISLKCSALLKRQTIKDRIPRRLPVDTVVAHKTGLEKGFCHDAGIVFTDKGDFLICVLTEYRDKNSRSAKRLISQLALLAYNYLQGIH